MSKAKSKKDKTVQKVEVDKTVAAPPSALDNDVTHVAPSSQSGNDQTVVDPSFQLDQDNTSDSSPDLLDMTIAGDGEQTIVEAPQEIDSSPDLLGKTVVDGQTPPPPAPPGDMTVAMVPSSIAAGPSHMAATISPNADTVAQDDLSKTIQDKWAATIVGIDSPELSLKEDASSAGNTSLNVLVKPHIFGSVQSPSTSGKQRKTTQAIKKGADYELVEILGKGGMGVVYTARQTSVDRIIAIKMVKGDMAQQEDTREKFLAEGALTAFLDHPNIVPVYDLGSTDDGTLFYAMKKVKGQPWCDKVETMELTENLDTLKRVMDAMAFAHDKEVIHRDLKPENVMIGEYGEVLVMDWGLAASTVPGGKAEYIADTNICCGTPCYMSPEMANPGEVPIEKHSDIYLLGGILYEIVSGLKPHTGKSVLECLTNAAMNVVQETPINNELVDIAMIAMSTEPENRYRDVKHMQEAIREYEEHFESTTLSGKSHEYLEKAEANNNYDTYSKALYGFQEAQQLWSKNHEAVDGEIEARLAYAECALSKEDLDLAGSLLLPDEEAHADACEELKKARKAQVARQRRMKIMTYGTIGGVSAAVLALVVGMVLVNNESARAKDSEIEAKKSANAAVKSADKAKVQEAIAKKEKEDAVIARADAETQKKEAEKATTVAEEKTEEAQQSLNKMVEAQKAQKEAQEASKVAQAKEAEVRKELEYKLKIQQNKWWVYDAATAKTNQADAAKQYGLPIEQTMSLPDGLRMEFALIPPGKFGMGSAFEETDRAGEEYLHEVKIAKPYYIAKHELTRRQYKAIGGKLPDRMPIPKGKNMAATMEHPLVMISWNEVSEKLLPLLQKHVPAGFALRLPTEAEWEYACRAGSNSAYNCGGDEKTLSENGWFRANSSRVTHPVGTKKPNPWGLFDMHGNAAEFCVDTYNTNFYLEGKNESPVNAEKGKRKIYRGGGWINTIDQSRAAYRSWAHVDNRHDYIGVRLVLVKK